MTTFVETSTELIANTIVADRTRTISVLVLGQTPPPVHGQSIMTKALIDGPIEGVTIYHIRMAYSTTIGDVGRFQIGKVLHLIALILRTILAKLRYNPEILYYIPSGPNKIPLLRDIVFLLSTRWMFSKSVFHFHASGVSEYIPTLPQWLRTLAMLALKRPSAGIQLSEHTVSDPKFLQSKMIFTVPNGTPDMAAHFKSSRLKPNLLKSNHLATAKNVTASPLKILYLGTVCESKGILVALDACSILRQRNILFHLDIVGGFQPSSFEAIVADRIAASALNQNVSIHYQKTGDEKWQRFANADVFCFPTFYESEGFPCVLLEAMSFGLPCIATRWRGIPSIVTDRETGYLIEPNDITAVADKLELLAKDRIHLAELGDNAREKYISTFTTTHFLKSMSNVFREVSSR